MKLSKNPQGSTAWLEERKTRVTASDASVINGTNKFGGNSPMKLWKKKLGLLDDEPLNHAMMEGSLLEEEALELFNKKHSSEFIKPPGGYHDEYDWMMASLDGYDEDNKEYIVEIKCGVATYDKAEDGIIPPYYIDQMQHQLFVSGRKYCYYMAYRPGKVPIIMTVERDEEYFEKVFEKEKEFYDCLQKLVPPGIGEKEFIEITDQDSTDYARKWKEAKENLKISMKMEKEARETLLDLTDGGNCIFPDANVKVEMRVKKGAVDYDTVLKENGIDKKILENFRKPEAAWLQPSIIK